MQKKDNNHIRFDRDWNPKRIAMIFLVDMLKGYLRPGNVNIAKIDSDNYMYEILHIESGKQKDALAWFADEYSDKVFSFNWVCRVLSIFPDKIRAQVLDGEITFEDIQHIQVAFID